MTAARWGNCPVCGKWTRSESGLCRVCRDARSTRAMKAQMRGTRVTPQRVSPDTYRLARRAAERRVPPEELPEVLRMLGLAEASS